MWSLMIWTPLLGGVRTTRMNYTHMLIEHTCAVINWWIALRGWVRMIWRICTICRISLYNVDVSLLFWRWDVLGLYDCTCVLGGMIWTSCVHDVEDMHEWSEGSIIYTLQLVCLERQVCSVSFPLVCQVGSGWSQWHFKCLAGRGSVWLQFS